MRWSKAGANNLAKALYRKENKELVNTIECYTDGLIFTLQMREVIEILSAAKTPKKDGKGNSYADRIRMHIPLLDAMQSASTKAFIRKYVNHKEKRKSANDYLTQTTDTSVIDI